MPIFEEFYSPWGGGVPMQGVIKDKKESDRRYNKRLQDNYFKGLKGLTRTDRGAFERQYAKELSLYDNIEDEEEKEWRKDQFFKRTVFKDRFKNAKDPLGKSIWEEVSRVEKEEDRGLTEDERDGLFARGVVDAHNQMPESEKDVKNYNKFLQDSYFQSDDDAIKQTESKDTENLYLDAIDRLKSLNGDDKALSLTEKIQNTLDAKEKGEIITSLDKMLDELSPLYKNYKNTDKFDKSEGHMLNLYAQYLNNTNYVDEKYARDVLVNTVKDEIASNQSALEKTGHAAMGVLDSGAGMMVRAVGMANALLNPAYFQDNIRNSSNFMEFIDKVVDNDITRWGDNMATTGVWFSKEEQEKYKDLGLNKYGIINDSRQEQQMLSANTPFELIQQYGFTVGSMYLGMGLGKLVGGASKLLARGLMTANRGADAAKKMQLLRAVAKSKDVANILVPGAVGTVEGGMNAAMTKEDTMQKFKDEIEAKYLKKARLDIAAKVEQNPEAAANLLRSVGEEVPNPELQGSKEKGFTQSYSNEVKAAMINALQNNESVLEAYRNKYKADIDEETKAAEEAALRAEMTDFVNNSVINGFLNSGLKATMQYSGVQKSLNKVKAKLGMKPESRVNRAATISRGEDNKWVAAIKKYTRKDAIKDRLKESLGEGLEEYSQDLSSSMGQEMANSYFQQYLDYKYSNPNGNLDAFEADFTQALGEGLGSALRATVDEQSIKSGLYGGLSTLMGGPNINYGMNLGKRQEGESLTQFLQRNSPIAWRGITGPLFNTQEIDEQNKKRQEVVDNLNKFFSDEEAQKKFFNSASTYKFLQDFDNAINNRDEKEARDARIGSMFSNIQTLQSLKGTAYYDAVMGSLNARANFDENNLGDDSSEESKAVEQYKEDFRRDAIDKGDDNVKILNDIKGSAQKMLDMMENVDETTEKVEAQFGDFADPDVKAGLVYQRIRTDEAKRRGDKVEEELQNDTKEITQESPTSSLSNTVKTTVAQLGNADEVITDDEGNETKATTLNRLDNAVKQGKEILNTIEESIAETKAKIKETEDSKEKQALNISLKRLKAMKSAIKERNAEMEKNKKDYINDAVTTDQEGNPIENTPVLSAADIMSLSKEDRAFMLDSKNRNLYSKEQQQIIDDLVAKGTVKDGNFMSKIQDSARLEEDYQMGLEEQLTAMSSVEGLNRMVDTIKYNMAVQNAKKQYGEELSEYLNDIDKQRGYQAFAEKLDNIVATGTRAEAQAIEEMYGGTDFYKRYVKSRKALEDGKKIFEGNKEYKNLDDDSKNILSDAIKFLSNNGQNLDADIANIFGDADTQKAFNEYRKKLNSTNEDLTQDQFNTIVSVLNSIKEDIENEKKLEEERQDNTAPIQPTPTNPEDNKPTSDAEIGVDDNPPASEEEEENNDAAELKEFQEVLIQSIETSPQGLDKDLAKNIIEETNGLNLSEALQYLTGRIEELSKEKANDSIVARLKGALANWSIKTEQDALVAQQENDEAEAEKAEKAKAEAEAKNKRKTIKDMFAEGIDTEGSNADATIMNSLDMVSMLEKHPDAPTTKHYTEHKVEDFLLSKEFEELRGKEKVKVYFLSDSALNDQIQQAMGESYHAEQHASLIAVVELPNNSKFKTSAIQIGKKYYQPIAYMPSPRATSTQGINNVQALREDAVKNEKIGVILNESTPSELQYITTEKTQSIAQTNPNKSIRDELAGKGWSINDIINNIEVRQVKGKNGKSRTALYFVRDNLIGAKKTNKSEQPIELYPVEIAQSADKDNTPVLDILTMGSAQEILNINEYFSEAGRTLKSLCEHLAKAFESDSFELNPNGDIEGQYSIDEKDVKTKDLSFPQVVGYFVQKFNNNFNIDGYSLEADVHTFNGNLNLSFYLRDGDNWISLQSIPLSDISDSSKADNFVANTLVNLIIDNNGVRRNAKGYPVVKYQVDYHKSDSKNKVNTASVRKALNNNILYASIDSLGRPKFLGISRPNPNKRKDEVANSDNADNGGANTNNPIDPDTGVPLDDNQGNPEPNPLDFDVPQVIKDARVASENINLTDIQATYQRNGKDYARTTSLETAIKDGSEHKDTDDYGKWATPSQAVGNTVDSFVRDYFSDGGLKEFKSGAYSNMTEKDYNNLKENLDVVKNTLAKDGWKVDSSGIKVAGILNTDEEGKQLRVTGTLDLLAYNAAGEVRIIDIKTVRDNGNVNARIERLKSTKWNKQVSVYAKLFEQQYGTKVTGLFILPIAVNYTEPKDTSSYKLADDNKTLLNADGSTAGVRIKGVCSKLDIDLNAPGLISKPLHPIEYYDAVDSPLAYDCLPDVARENCIEDKPKDTNTNVAPSSPVTNNTPQRGELDNSWDNLDIDKQNKIIINIWDTIKERCEKNGVHLRRISPTQLANIDKNKQDSILALAKEIYNELSSEEKERWQKCASD